MTIPQPFKFGLGTPTLLTLILTWFITIYLQEPLVFGGMISATYAIFAIDKQILPAMIRHAGEEYVRGFKEGREHGLKEK